MRTQSLDLHGPLVRQLVLCLLSKSQWFAVEPLPDDWWTITVKTEFFSALQKEIDVHAEAETEDKSDVESNP